MIKVHGRCDSVAAQRQFWAIEVVRTSGKARHAMTNKQLIALLEAVGEKPMADALLDIASQHHADVVSCTRPPTGEERITLNLLSRLAEHDENELERREQAGQLDPVVTTLDILSAGFDPFREPYLQQKIAQIVDSRLSKLWQGTFPIPDSAFAFGIPDPTGTLQVGTICLVQDDTSYIEREALVYRHPGLHPGDIRRVHVVTVCCEARLVWLRL